MDQTRITLHSDYLIAPVDSRIFGGFLEHLGRAVYQGVYQPDSDLADEDGLRRDVLEVLQKMRLTVLRYPGGNFASGYHWQDGIGPRASRPTVRELAWQSIEPNQFGTDEYIKLVRKMDWAPMLTVNLGTGTPEEARNWVEYCNCPAGTQYANLRVANGSPEPYGVKLWCLGNEMDGPWQLGHVPADQYAIRAQQAAKLMKDTDSTIELVACGSCTNTLPTYMEWDRTVLEYIGEYADYVSMHRYVGNPNSDTADYLAVTNSIDQQIEEMDAMCRYVQARLRSKKRHYLCFDEWNVWYRAVTPVHMDGRGQFAPHLIEEEYDLADALVVAGFLNCFIRHANVVKIANLAQIVNAIAPIQTRGGELLLHSTYYPFLIYAYRREGVALQPVVKGPGYASRSYGYVNTVDTSAILGKGVLHVFLVNRSLSEVAPVTIDFTGRQLEKVESAEVVSGPDAKAQNTFAQPHCIHSRPFRAVQVQDGKATVQLPALSVVALTFIAREEANG
ncbi:MAG: alpha-L-arabinofuranosidase C-terminal domain-containing protein [Anaerolineales bacterium]|jgi:alpha-N-arabinofuranosidase